MKIINTQEELEALIDDNGNIIIDDDLEINCSIEINANIKAWNIKAGDIKAWNIKAWNIKAGDIKAGDIKAGDIKAWNIEAVDINAGDIKAMDIEAVDIKAMDIKAWDIKALDISYYSVCFAYQSIICKSIKGRRDNSKHFVLDGAITEINNNNNKK